ncbi:hypothetical protein GCM10027169_39440 [Gordonia jinhuaensis]|uniref:NlpC/P60 domain-containing protein n=1 Tax=Gordonia jinhuaensis TaxID=1517702 RepID=A0A916WR27_9ACTN|nr:hypothetical protein GCM10011489_11070 [Gordonia jinhuaensis]
MIGAFGGPQAAATPRPESPGGEGGIAGLINKIADTDQTLADLDSTVAIKRQTVNRAVIDYQNALTARRLATVAADGAQNSLHAADGAVAAAQHKFDELMRSAYVHGGTTTSMTNYLSTSDPDSVLDRASVIDQLGRQQQATIDALTRQRNEQANKAAAAEATRRQAVQAAGTAAARKNDALGAITEALDALKTEQQKRASLISARDAAQQRLNMLRAASGVAAAPGGSDTTPANSTPTNPNPTNPTPASPNPAATSPSQPAAQAPSASGPAGAAAVAVPAPGAPAGPGVPASTPAAAQVGPDPQAAQQQAMAAAGKVAVQVAVDGAESILAALVTAIQNSGSSDTSDSAAATTPDGDSTSDSDSSSDTPTVTGSAGIEMVINRAESQLGVPYAWGGGDADGPTLGIHDGGVADSYGDYNKIGFDCSGLMIYAFAAVGISLPHYTGYQYTSGPHVPLSDMQRGDMIFYGPNASEHVALYLGNNQMIEAPESGDVVKISALRTAGAMPYVVRML